MIEQIIYAKLKKARFLLYASLEANCVFPSTIIDYCCCSYVNNRIEEQSNLVSWNSVHA
jgi:hypothetical protein